jgi:hypothetical protein
MENAPTFTAFTGQRRIATGDIRSVLTAIKRQPASAGQVLIFSDQSGAQHEFDLEGSEAEVLARLENDPTLAPSVPPPARSGPGRPRLGVVSREVSLLPRHWEWLERQPGGASASIRRLVEHAKKSGARGERAREARYAAGKFMWGIAGDLPNFEEASRALYAKDQARLEELIASWPEDIRAHALHLTRAAARLDEEARGETAAAPPDAEGTRGET